MITTNNYEILRNFATQYLKNISIPPMAINNKAIRPRAHMLAAVAALCAISACTGGGSNAGNSSIERHSAAAYADTTHAAGAAPYPSASDGNDDGKKDGVPLGSCSTEGISGDRASVRVNPYYDAGYERGYDDGYLDGEENIRENSYDSRCRYTGYKRRQYKEGYDEGYEAGFDDGYADSGGNPDDEE